RRHVIDVRFAISRTVVFGAITTLVVGIIAVVDWATSVYLSQLRIALAIDALVTIALGIALHRTYGAIENAVDFLVYRRKHDAETYLRRLARTLLRAEREETIDRALVTDPYEKLQLDMAALFRNTDGAYTAAAAAGWDRASAFTFERDDDIVRFLTTERALLNIADLREHVRAEFRESGAVPAIAVPVLEGDALYGFAIYGLHRDATKLDPDEVEVLETLCQTAAQAYVRIEVLRLRAMMAPIGAAT
ncbi:MAG: GAF domain-containing protein, partial [Candidatus Eremiobacteraeota bacterium]|nr:GAF domain-containing protein [Candidatus Eremiobacteraeota bacterium]